MKVSVTTSNSLSSMEVKIKFKALRQSIIYIQIKYVNVNKLM
jgi:hypothetical protein